MIKPDTETGEKIERLNKQSRYLLMITCFFIVVVIILTLYVYLSYDMEKYYGLKDTIFFLAFTGLVFDALAYRAEKSATKLYNEYYQAEKQ